MHQTWEKFKFGNNLLQFESAFSLEMFDVTYTLGACLLLCEVSKKSIRVPFYRHGGHIELIRFKEYYGMLRGHEHISFVFSRAFRDILS